jgi:hypothetical protein
MTDKSYSHQYVFVNLHINIKLLFISPLGGQYSSVCIATSYGIIARRYSTDGRARFSCPVQNDCETHSALFVNWYPVSNSWVKAVGA